MKNHDKAHVFLIFSWAVWKQSLRTQNLLGPKNIYQNTAAKNTIYS